MSLARLLSAATSFLALTGPAFADDLSVTSLGEWTRPMSAASADPAPIAKDIRSTEPTRNMPKNGTATYVGSTQGTVTSQQGFPNLGPPTTSNFTGTAQLDVNFRTSSLTATMSGAPGHIQPAPWTDVPISGNQYQQSAQKFIHEVDQTINGTFFGNRAATTAGSWSLNYAQTGLREQDQATFGATRGKIGH